VGFLGVPPVEERRNKVSVEDLRSVAEENDGAHIRFSYKVCSQAAIEWNAIMMGRCLFLKPGESLPDGSKGAFVALLEYAEEYLNCSHIYVVFKKNSVPRAMVRTFQFLGFSLVRPSDERAPPSSQFLSLVYAVSDDTDDEDDDDSPLQ